MKSFIFIAIMLTFSFSQASFSPISRRYLSPMDLIGSWIHKFPSANLNPVSVLPGKCKMLLPSYLPTLGAVLPDLGKATSDRPTPAFVRYIAECSLSYIDSDFYFLGIFDKDASIIDRYFPAELKAKYQLSPGNVRQFVSQAWDGLSDSERNSLLEFQINRLIGPANVIADMGYVKSQAELKSLLLASLPPNQIMSIETAMKKILFFLLMRDEFLTY